MTTLTTTTLIQAAQHLAAREETLGRVFNTYGAPPMWRRPTGFATLVHIILEQQVSLKSAKAMLLRLQAAIDPFTPECFVELGDAHLRRLGVTRQKSSYLIHLSESIVSGEFDFRRLARLDNYEAQVYLTRLKGIGSWSADVYLLMAMRRADIWPAGDLALAVAVKDLFQLEKRPTPEELERIAERWRPYRAVAARMLWQHYLGKKTV